jgi:hypothetical protein
VREFDEILSRYRKGGELILSKKAIETIACFCLQLFCPNALKEPTPVFADEFIENFLQYNLRYEHLSNNHSVLGTIAFRAGELTIYDAEHNDIMPITVDKHTIILDKDLTEEGNKGRYEFTGFHESGHAILHQPEIVDYDIPDGIISCRNTAEGINTSLAPGKKTPTEWREWQADYFASCMKLPRWAVTRFAREFLRSIGHMQGTVTVRDNETEILANEILPEAVADFFVTSKQAARIKLIELRIIKLDDLRYSHLSDD